MEDIFYFAQARITLDDIAVEAKTLGHRVHQFRWSHSNELNLNVYFDSDRVWLWSQLPDDPSDRLLLDEADLATLKALGYESSFMVSMPGDALRKLIPLLKALLFKYGGWIGGDTEELKPIFTFENIDQLSYPMFSSDSER